MSLAVRPASLRAAADASAASCSSDRPEFLENSVWPIPTSAMSSVLTLPRSGPSVALRSGGRLSLAGRRRPLAHMSSPTGGHPALRPSRGAELREADGSPVEGVKVSEVDLHGHVVLDVVGLDALQ